MFPRLDPNSLSKIKGRECIVKPTNKIAIVNCSNGQKAENRHNIEKLKSVLNELGLEPVLSDYIYEKDAVFSGSARQRAEALMNFYKDDEIKAIYDISGGDIANEILPYLDFEVIKNSQKSFWGYSDLTTIINAIYAKTEKASVLYQIKNLIYEDSKNQIQRFKNLVLNNQQDIFNINYTFVQKEDMQGVVVGGNIRCLLKLAGTEYFPDMQGKTLLLEARSGQVPQMVTYLNQLKQMGVFDKVSGILLGTFTEIDSKGCKPDIVELVKIYAGSELPIAVTKEIGHGADSKAVMIGKYLTFTNTKGGEG